MTTHVPHRPQSSPKPDSKGKNRGHSCGTMRTRYRGKVSDKQKIWEYIRRQGSFRVGDMLMIFSIKEDYARRILSWLERTGYIRLEVEAVALRHRIYRRVAKMPAIAPTITQAEKLKTITPHSQETLAKITARKEAESWHMHETLDPNILIASPHHYATFRAPAFRINLSLLKEKK